MVGFQDFGTTLHHNDKIPIQATVEDLLTMSKDEQRCYWRIFIQYGMEIFRFKLAFMKFNFSNGFLQLSK